MYDNQIHISNKNHIVESFVPQTPRYQGIRFVSQDNKS